MIKASIITIGDELLIGQVIDTNSAWIAQQLNKIGIQVCRRVAVGDVKSDIIKALNDEQSNSEIILLTGGLGPTADDITKPLLCEYFDGKMIVSQPALENVIHIIERIYKRTMNDRNRKQAEVPDTCTVLLNPRGTAPGMWFEKNNRIFVSMPGVPHEMKGLMEEEVIPRLQKRFHTSHIAHKTLVTYGIGESMLADILEPFESSLPAHIKLAYLPNQGLIRLRLTSTGNDSEQVDRSISESFESLKLATKDYLIATEDAPMEKIVMQLLQSRNKTLATAESCTGGYIAHLITSIPGSSSIFKGSVVAYANEVKEQMLGVQNDTLQNHGAVSEAVVIQMAEAVLKRMQTDYAIAVSGIMGPDGGTDSKPIGTVWVAVSDKNETIAKSFHFRFDRIRNIQLTAMNALNLLRQVIWENH